MPPTGLVVFAITWALVSARRVGWLPLDRPGAALLGAAACVGLGVLAPARALASIDGATLVLLFGTMGLGAVLDQDGLFEGLAARAARVAPTPGVLLGVVVWGAGLLAAFLTNDAVCVLGAPLVIGLVRRHGLPPLPYLLALATAANTGSAATLVGNPQNMLCASLGGLRYLDHLALGGPVAVAGLVLNHAVLAVGFRRVLAAAPTRLEPEAEVVPFSPRVWVSLGVVACTAGFYALGADLAWTAVAALAVLMVIRRRDTRGLWARVDGSLLLFFAGLFVVVEGLVSTGLPADWLAGAAELGAATGAVGWLGLAGVFLVGSNVVSNVPFILVVRGLVDALPDPRLGWELLALASTFAGNLTLLGSAANVIVAEAARDVGGLGFREHLRVGAPIALSTTALAGVAVWLAAG